MKDILTSNGGDKKYLGEYLEGWIEEDIYYLAMPLYDEDLAKYVEKKPPSQNEILILAEQIFRGINFLHSKGYVHKDIKLENIMLFNSQIKIVDFNTMRQIDKTLTHNIGTYLYFAPELFTQAEKTKPNEKTDYFSLGVVLMELCSGSRAENIAPNYHYFDMQGTNEEFWHAKMIQSMKESIRPPVCNALQSLAISLMKREPALRPAFGTVMAVFDAIRRGQACSDIIRAYNLKDASKVKLPQESSSFAVAEPIVYSDWMKCVDAHYEILKPVEEDRFKVQRKKDNLCVTITKYHCTDKVAPMQILFNESCTDEYNQTAIDCLQNDSNYQLFLPYLKVVSMPTLNVTIVETQDIQINLLNEHTQRIYHKKYWTLTEMLNWITPTVKALEYMHQKEITCKGVINKKHILKDKHQQVRFFCDYEICTQVDETAAEKIQAIKNKDVIALGKLLLEMITLQAPSLVKSIYEKDIMQGQLHDAMNVHPEVETAPFEKLRNLVIQMIIDPLLCVSMSIVRAELEIIAQTVFNNKQNK